MAEDEMKSPKIPKPTGKIVTKWIKNAEDIAGMRKASAFNGVLMDYIRDYVKEGISTSKIDDLVREYTLDHGHTPACINYRGYPKASCISINEVVCHGVPNENLILKNGDIVNVDLTTIVNGYHGDQSETFLIGDVSSKARELTIAAANSLVEGITCVTPGTSFAKIGEVIENYVTRLGFSVVVDYTGHGIGKAFHEDPPIYHFKNTETAPYLMAAGMTFTIEPMINEGTWRVLLDKNDGWTVRTKDGKLSAQFEHTVLVTEKGFEILTLTPSQAKAGKITFLATHPLNSLKR